MKTLIKKTLLVLMVAFIAVFTLGVTSKVKAATVAKLHTSELVEGDYVIAYNNYAMKNTVSSSRLSYSTVEVLSNNSISNPDASIVWHIAPSGNYWTIYNASVNKYAASTGAKNKAQLLTSGSGDKALWTVSFENNTFEFVNKANAAAAVNKNLRNNGTFGFACYSTSTGGALSLYKVGEASSTESSIVIAGDSNVMLGNNVTLTATTTNTTSEVVWSSNDNAVATVVNGVVTPVKMGTVTITAKLADDETVFASHSIKVYPNNENPITVAEAIDVCNLAGSSNSPYKYTVVGTVSSDPTYNEQYNSYTFNLTDETGTIKVYSSVGEGTPVNGNNVSVNGNLILYSSTCEFNYNSTFEILVDSNLADFLENLNTINSYMSLAYEYKTTFKNVATSENKTISFTDTANRVSFSTSSQIWETNGLTVTNNKASSTSNVADYKDPVRFYKSSEIILSSDTAFTTVVFESSANDGSKASQQYLTLLENSLSSLNANYSTEGTTVTLTLAAPVNTLSFVAAGQVRLYTITTKCEGGEQTVYENAEFRIKCAVDSALTSLSGLTGDEEYDWGISVTANGQTKYYNSTSEFIVSDDENNKKYVIISLGDVLNEVTKAKTEFTVRAYVEIDGDKYVSNEFKTYSVESMIKEYNTNGKYSDYKTQIAPLVEVLSSLGCDVE